MKLLFISLIVLLTCTETPKKTASFKSVVVLELFTSQGCSSCPPADALLDHIKETYNSSEVIALSYHVDYWNYIGWKDPFSTPEYSDLQRQYGQKFNNSTIYTPQMIVNGKEHFVGSDESILNSKIESYAAKNSTNSVAFGNVKRDANTISFTYNVTGDIGNHHLKIVLIIDERSTSISRGENKNRILKNINIAVQESDIKLNGSTGKGTIQIPELVKSSDQLSIIGLIETSDLDIIGANQVKL